MAAGRKKSREIAFRMIFSLASVPLDPVASPSPKVLSGLGQAEAEFPILLELAADGEVVAGPELEFVRAVFLAAAGHMTEIDAEIGQAAKGFSIERIFKTDLAVLRTAIAEMRFVGTAAAVVINECVEIAKRYGTEKSGGFVNGVLGKVARGPRSEGESIWPRRANLGLRRQGPVGRSR
jgi:N utilization substance protein B